MIRNFGEFRELAEGYAATCRAFLTKHALSQIVGIDHICYKCPVSGYEFMRNLLEEKQVGLYSYQERLSGRRVAYIQLHVPLKLGGYYHTSFVELAEAKPGPEEKPGFHHVEMFPFDWAGMNRDELGEMLQKAGETPVLKERPHHTTLDITLQNGFIIRLTERPLIEKIKEGLNS